ncbi:MAG: hypothetical protein ACXVCE_01860, partial [Bacteriovorax sp.]
MLKFIFLIVMGLSLIFSCPLFAKTVECEVFTKKSEINKEMSETDLLTLNGLRQTVTSELEGLKLDSKDYWEKLDQKKMDLPSELQFLRALFENIVISQAAPMDARDASEETKKEDKLSGFFKADLSLEKLKENFTEVTTNIAEIKMKTFYILANIDLDSSVSWDDLGVSKSSSFSGVIIDSWKKLALSEFKNFERIQVLEKDFADKPNAMNPKSVTLKWSSVLKKVASNADKKTATFALSAQYILVNTKTNAVLLSFDFPLQKREFGTQDKKALSSSLASLVYNLLLSQKNKIESLVLEEDKALSMSEVEVKIKTLAGLSDIYAINSLLQEKFRSIKLTSTLKS